MHILAERVPSENPNIQAYEVKNGGGILKEGGHVKFSYNPTEQPSRPPQKALNFESKRTSIAPGIKIGTGSRSSLPVISEGIGVPYVFELTLGGRTKFNGHFNAKSLSLETTGVTSHPTTGSRAAVMRDFLQSIAKNDRQITAISADPAKNIDINIGLSFNQSRSSTYSGF